MALAVPVSVKIGGRPLAVVVDGFFALSPFGLLATMALTGSALVYLPRSLLALLDNHEAYRREPTLLGGPCWRGEPELMQRIAGELEGWRRAWHFGRLAARVHWIGDAGYESMLVDREDSGLLARFEHCASAFDLALAEGPLDLQAPLDACARDALALAAALQPDPVVVLTRGGPGLVPLLCQALSGGGLACASRHGEPPTMIAAAFEPAATALALADAAIVEVLAPAALALPEGWNGEQDWACDEDCSDSWDIWHDARFLWSRLGDEVQFPAVASSFREQAA